MLISEFRDPVRFYLNDNGTPSQYSDSAIDRGVKVLVRGGMFPGYSLTPNGLSITPEPTAAIYTLIGLKTARVFNSGRPDSFSFRTRAYSESSSGATRETGWTLEQMIHEIESGGMIDGWQSLASWLAGFEGVKATWLHLVNAKINAPFSEVTISESGVDVG